MGVRPATRQRMRGIALGTRSSRLSPAEGHASPMARVAPNLACYFARSLVRSGGDQGIRHVHADQDVIVQNFIGFDVEVHEYFHQRAWWLGRGIEDPRSFCWPSAWPPPSRHPLAVTGTA